MSGEDDLRARTYRDGVLDASAVVAGAPDNTFAKSGYRTRTENSILALLATPAEPARESDGVGLREDGREGRRQLFRARYYEARATAAESARDAAEGVVREVRGLLVDEDGIHRYPRWMEDEIRAVLDRLTPVTTDATEGEA